MVEYTSNTLKLHPVRKKVDTLNCRY